MNHSITLFCCLLHKTLAFARKCWNLISHRISYLVYRSQLPHKAPNIEKADKVLIIGAGPGGLALAQILRKQHISFEIFERDDSQRGRTQGWAVALIEVLPDLRRLLPSDIGDVRTTSVNHGVSDVDEIALLNGSTGEHIASLGGVPVDHPGFILRVGRERLRDYLWAKISVSAGKKFTHYEEDEDGVVAFFEDGTSARGSILVGADGAHSHVRSQLLGRKHQPVPSALVPIVGICDDVPRHVYEPLHDIGTAAIISSGPGVRYLIGLRSIVPDRSSANYYYALCFQSENPEADSAWAQTASKEALYNKAIEITKKMPPLLRDIVKYTGVDKIATPPLKFVEFEPPEEIPSGRVTLMGDSAHSMIPFCIAGANTAVQDACDLGRMLTKSAEEGSDFKMALREYEKLMLPRGRRNVLMSRQVGESGNLMSMVAGRVNTKDMIKGGDNLAKGLAAIDTTKARVSEGVNQLQ